MCLKDVLSLFSIIENTFNYFLKTIIEIVSASLPFIVIYHIDNNGLLICKGLKDKSLLNMILNQILDWNRSKFVVVPTEPDIYFSNKFRS